MDSLGALQAFVHAADSGGFTEAGRKLGVSASAISKAVQRLEDRMGARLFHRSTRSVTLTADGALFLDRCRRILDEFEAAEAELSQKAPRGTLRVSLPSMGMVFAPGMAAFRRRHPQVELDLDFSDRVVDVVGEGFDAVIRVGEHTDSRLMSRVIGQYRRVIVGAPGYLASAGTPQTPEDLRGHSCLLYRSPTTGKLDEWPLPQTPTGTVVMNTLEPQIVMAMEGAGLACVPDIAVARQLQAGTLVSVLDSFLQKRPKISVLWPTSRHLSPKVRAFVDCMMAP